MFRKFFGAIDNCDDLKAAYRKLCKQLHPDNGGSAKDFVEMKDEFRKLWDELKNVRKTMEGKRYNQKEYKQEYKSADEFMDLVDFLTHNLKVTTEINGTFIHIWGIEKTDKEKQGKLKEYLAKMPKLKLTFSGQKKCWRIYPADYVKKTGKTWSMDAIRSGFGSTVYNPSDDFETSVAVL